MARWADFSGRPPGAAALKAAGFVGVLRYIGLGSEGKQIHRAEWEDYLRHGLLVLLVAELGTNDAWAALDDYATGRARAELALADVRAEAPASVDPGRVRISCAADAHASSAGQISDAVAYSRGFASVLGVGQSGFYGFVETSRAVHDADTVGWHWRCGSEPSELDKRWVNFWQRNRPPTAVVINGTTCDINETLAPLEDDVLTTADGTVKWEAINPYDQTTVESHSVAQWLGSAEFRSRRFDELLNQLVAKVDAGFGALTDDEAKIIAATRQIVAEDPDAVVELTPEQIDQFANRVLEPLPAHIREAVREAFARAGQPEGT